MVLAVENPSLTDHEKLRIRAVPPELVKEKDAFIRHAREIYLGFMSQRSEPKKEWRMFWGRRWQDAWDAAQLTAGEDAKGKPVKDEWSQAANNGKYSLPNAPTPALNAALSAGLNAALEAADRAGRKKAVKEAQSAILGAGDEFEFSVGLMAGLILVKDLDFEGKDRYIKHAEERIEVFERGYGLAYDVNGELYVYAVTPYQIEPQIRKGSL